jgi:hypothetical protein
MGKVWMPGGGGGADLDAVTADKSDVLAGKVIVDKEGEPLTGTLAFSGDASNDQVLAGRSYYNTDPKNKQTGSMPNYSTTPTAIDAIRINNNRFEVAVARGFHGYNWAGGGYEYMSYDQVANAIGLTPNKLKKGEWVCGRTGTFEGYVPTATDLYLRGNNGHLWSLGIAAGRIYFESGQITFTNTITSDIIYINRDLSGYSYVNLEFWAMLRGGIRLSVSDNADYNNYLSMVTNNDAGTGTISLNVTNINANRYIRIGSYTNTGANFYVYRVWLS